jgi:hypothetical protein
MKNKHITYLVTYSRLARGAMCAYLNPMILQYANFFGHWLIKASKLLKKKKSVPGRNFVMIWK